MSQDEVASILTARFQSERASWEQTRTLSFYTVVAQQGTKQYRKPQDLFPLAWDKGDKPAAVHAPRLTKDEFLKAAKQIR